MHRHLIAVSIVLWAFPATADQLRVIAVGTVAPAMKQLLPAFEQTTGHSVQITYGNSGTTIRNLRENPTADVGLIPQSAWSEAKATGAFDELSRVLIAKTRIGVGIKAVSPPVEITSVDAIKTTMENADAICMVDPNGGSAGSVALLKAFDRMGISEQVRRKLKFSPSGEKVGEAVAHGECAIGITNISELRAVPGVKVLGALPSDVTDSASVTYAVVLNKSERRDVARQFTDFLSSRTAKEVFTAAGLDPDQ
jgi:molybdate transport system substrate-binding protein